MQRYLVSLFALVLAACARTESPPGGGDSEPDVVEAPVAATADSASTRPTVVFLGTSLTAGLGLPRDEDTYVARVAELAAADGAPIRVVNAGVSGETSAGGLRRLDWALREPLDVLVLELGANDGLRGQDPGALERNLTEIVGRTRARYPDARIVIAGMEAPPNLGPMYTEAFRSVFPRVAAESGATLIPFLLEGVAGVRELNQGDGIHPTAEGHERIADTVWEALRPVVEGLGAGGP